MIIIKTEPFKTLIISCNGSTNLYHYKDFNEFISILKNNYYNDLNFKKDFSN